MLLVSKTRDHKQKAVCRKQERQHQVWWSETTGLQLGHTGIEHLTSKNCFRRMKEPICPELVIASIL